MDSGPSKHQLKQQQIEPFKQQQQQQRGGHHQPINRDRLMFVITFFTLVFAFTCRATEEQGECILSEAGTCEPPPTTTTTILTINDTKKDQSQLEEELAPLVIDEKECHAITQFNR